MSRPDTRRADRLTGKRVLVAGVESEPGRTIATGLSEAGASVAVVATINDPDEAFATQRLARKLGGPGQAIDGTNDMAVRVMVRQISKELGGLDSIVLSTPPAATELIAGYGSKELGRSGGRHLVVVGEWSVSLPESSERTSWTLVRVEHSEGDDEGTAAAVARVIEGRQLLD